MINNKPNNNEYERNVYSPRSDKLSFCLPLNEASGTSLDAIGTRVLSGSAWADPHLTGDGPSWLDTEGGAVSLTHANDRIILASNSSGDDILYPRGTIMMRFSKNTSFSIDVIMYGGSLRMSSTGAFLVHTKVGGTIIEVRHQINGANSP